MTPPTFFLGTQSRYQKINTRRFPSLQKIGLQKKLFYDLTLESYKFLRIPIMALLKNKDFNHPNNHRSVKLLSFLAFMGENYPVDQNLIGCEFDRCWWVNSKTSKMVKFLTGILEVLLN